MLICVKALVPRSLYSVPGFNTTGAAIAGGTHYVTTAKRLAEEGIDPTQRVRAMPVAVSTQDPSMILETCTACTYVAA